MNAIDFAHEKTKRHLPTLNSSVKSPCQGDTGASECLLEELGINRQQFHVLFDNLPQGIALKKIVYNEKGKPFDFIHLENNPAYNEINPFKGKHCWHRTVLSNTKIKDLHVDWVDVYGGVDTTGIPRQFDVYCAPQSRWYHVYVYSPKKGYCISAFVDITAQKKLSQQKTEEQTKAKQALLSTEKRFRRLYETTQDGIMARDIHGKMIDCNNAYARMLGYTKKELRSLTIQQLLPEEWYDRREKVVKRVLRTGRSVLFEREYKRNDGSVFPASVRTWRLTDGKGKVIGIWSIVRDITEQKKHQKNLEQHAEVLEKIIEDRTKQLKDSERLAAIGQTAGMVGHDLRNPLQTVTGELYLAKSEVASLADGEVKNNLQESIQVIEEQAGYMDKIVSDLQAFVQPVRVDKKPIDLKELLDSVLATITIPTNVTVKTTIQENFPQIKADPQLLKRVLINLVTNVVQAMPDGGQLTITSAVNSAGQPSVTVKDTGVGIPDHIKRQIFTPLFTTKPRGQGFGLAVCKRVIEAHGGTISFESTAGKGAEFTIHLVEA